MNRLIIIGNGFDLAHGLRTRYIDFISNYWSSISNPIHNDDLISLRISPDVDIRGSNSLKCMLEKVYQNSYHGSDLVFINLCWK